MKKVIIAALALTGFSTASFAQAVQAVKKSEPSKMQVVKKQTAAPATSKVVALHKVTAPATKTVTAPAATKVVAVSKVTAPVTKTVTAPAATKVVAVNKVTKPVATAPAAKPVTIAKVNSAAPLKKDGTPDMRFKANKKHN